MHKLCTTYSSPLLEHDETVYHLFPSPNDLPEKLEKELRDLGFGYRAAFIESSLATLRAEHGDSIEAGLASWRSLPISDARERLIALKGVGRKVADCVMLMCLDQPSVIPIDTHVAAIAARYSDFPSRLRRKPMSKQLYDEVQEFLAGKWGDMGGWCQAVMFAADLKPKKRPNGDEAIKIEAKEVKDEMDGDLKREIAMVAESEVKKEVETPAKKRKR
jgi:N-glycosylase/DNA lyase